MKGQVLYMSRILIIEDDKEILKILSDFLSGYGFEAVGKTDGRCICQIIRHQNIDLVLLDLMLPYKSGDQLLKEIRSCSDLPVIVISARGTTQNKIDLLRLGADETLARIESNLRRSKLQTFPKKVLKFQELTLDTGSLTAYLKGVELSLTAKEFRILELLMRYPDKIFSKANLFQSIWGSEYLSEDNTLNVHISHLRNKLKAVSSENEYIDTVWGIGYRLHKD